MAFKRPLPEWNNPGVEPPQSKKDMGWLGREKPPAQWHNWFQHLVFKALEELQQNAAHVTFGVTAPISPDVNDLWVDTSEFPVFVLKAWDGTQWITVGAVNSVNGKTGDVELTAEDVGAASMTAFNAHLNDKLQDGVHGLATTQNMTLYVDGTNGDDSNDGLTPQTAFRTIQKAVDSVPKILRHPVTINIADGVYDESVFVCGFRSEPSIPGVDFNLEIIGNNDDATAVKLNSIYFESNVSGVVLEKVEMLGPISCRHNVAVSIKDIISKEPTEYALTASFSNVRIENSEISNKTRAISAYNGSFIHSFNNTGTDNDIRFYSSEGSIIVKNGSQPQGNEEILTGGIVVGNDVKFRHDLTLLGRKINIEIPTSTGGWARGVFYYPQGGTYEDEDVVGSIGAYGPLGNVFSYLYMAIGPSPWNNKGLRVKADGSVVIFDGTAERTVWHAGNAGPFYRGRGSPEGNVTAPPGSLYQNLDGGQGTTIYYKASGTGNTGWRAVS